MKYVIANWKAHKNFSQAKDWIETFLSFPSLPNAEIIIAPSYPYLPFLHEKIQTTNLKLASQDISHFEEGAHTGEVTIEMISDLIQYTIVGHSERRKEFHEQIDTLTQKIHLLKKNAVEPIFCVRGIQDVVPSEANIIAYEPEGSIGNGDSEDIGRVLHTKKSLQITDKKFIYGGSVNTENAHIYLSHPEIDGVLVGTDCADPHHFYEIAKHVV